MAVPPNRDHPLSSGGGGGKLRGSPLAGPPASAGGRALNPMCWYRLQSNRCNTSRLIGGRGCFICEHLPLTSGLITVSFHRGHLAQATAPRCLLSLSHATMARQHHSGLRAGHRGTVACSSVCTVWLLLRCGRPGAPVPASAGTRKRLRPLGKLSAL